MSLSKVVFLLSLIGVTILFTVGLVNPNSPVMWLASTSINFAIVRFAMMIALALLLATNPPRDQRLRYAIGGLALFLTAWAINFTYANDMKLLDSMTLVLFSVSAGLDVLEIEPAKADRRKARTKTAHSH